MAGTCSRKRIGAGRTRQTKPAEASASPPLVLALQAGGALGACHAGVLQGLDEAGTVPDWIVGISVGAIHAARVAGDAPTNRAQALHDFCSTIFQPNLPLPTTPPETGLDQLQDA